MREPSPPPPPLQYHPAGDWSIPVKFSDRFNLYWRKGTSLECKPSQTVFSLPRHDALGADKLCEGVGTIEPSEARLQAIGLPLWPSWARKWK